MRYVVLLGLYMMLSCMIPTYGGIEADDFKPKTRSMPRQVSAPARARPLTRIIEAVATAYDISIESCGKTDDITKSGFNLTGHTWDTARAIAVDPNVIPLGTEVKLSFPNVPQYDGVYVARDVGGAIKGNRIDVFIESRKKCFEFGRQPVIIEILGISGDIMVEADNNGKNIKIDRWFNANK